MQTKLFSTIEGYRTKRTLVKESFKKTKNHEDNLEEITEAHDISNRKLYTPIKQLK